jgi:acyl-CoA synthetase (AMP-forming)/AMP-acid ligase II
LSGWNIGSILEAVASARPDATVQIHGEREITWAEHERRAQGVVSALLQAGAGRQAKVAQYLYNCPEYMESFVACFKGGFVPVNTNYRYREGELLYLWDNADVFAVVFHGCFADTIADLRDRLPGIQLWLWVDDGSGPCPDWAIEYEDAARAEPQPLPWERDGDDLLLLYTGGTTGMPKGVMWRQDDLFRIANRGRQPEPYDLERGLDGIRDQVRAEGGGRVSLPACPLMHGTGMLTALFAMVNGGTVVTMQGRRFDPIEMLDTIQARRVEGTAIVGDAFARPLLEHLDAHPQHWDISSLVAVVSSGTMWSQEIKNGLLKHHPDVILRDGLGSSESLGMGTSESTGKSAVGTARFELGEDACVLSDDGRVVEPGSGERGRLAVSGFLPVGYYKDPEKTAATFPVIEGVRYSIAGDYATVEADGTITLLGRGSVCINTGGEKVFPEEVEEVLKQHDKVIDAACVGVPDQRFGNAITALVEASDDVLEAELILHVKSQLAAYKAPKRILFVDSVGRSPSAKLDYKALREEALRQLERPL